MRKLIIHRLDPIMGEAKDVDIVFNSAKAGIFRKEDKVYTCPINKGEIAVQVGVKAEDTPVGYLLSNAVFAMGNKDVEIDMSQSGTNFHLDVTHPTAY